MLNIQSKQYFSKLPLSHFQLTSISPIDGRYSKHTKSLNELLSEYGLIKERIFVEIKWLQTLSNIKEIPQIKPLSNSSFQSLNNIYNHFSLTDALLVKQIEQKTNHDVKAIEYFIKKKISNIKDLLNYSEFVHLFCTSEDISNVAYALIIKKTRSNILNNNLNLILVKLKDIMGKYKRLVMVSRTHGQIATPTTFGKEYGNFFYRLKERLKILNDIKITAKINGTVGNFNANFIAYPNVDWIKVSREFIENDLRLSYHPFTTQIEPHDNLSALFNTLSQINTILIDLCRDTWNYISIGYIKQKLMKGEVGSSIMPHKINPIDFENAEGNLGLANAILNHLSSKLPISRFQRDLSDSTVLRNIGVGIAYSVIAYKSVLKGLNKIDINKEKIKDELENSWELLAEPIQTIMRKNGIPNSYETLKEITRGKNINKDGIRNFIKTKLDSIDIKDKEELLKLTPDNYIGLAEKIVEEEV